MTCRNEVSPVVLTELPFWNGLTAAPSQRIRTAPFTLGCASGGWIAQTTPQETIDSVLAAYGDGHYAFITTPPGGSAWADSLGERNIAEVLAACGDWRPSSILEIGGGSLYVASRLKALLGPDTYTLVDPAAGGDTASPIEVIADYFPCAGLNGRRYDLIVSFNCLEHVPDPQAFLNGVAGHLTKDGMAVVIAPDIERQFIAGDLNAILHEHISYLTLSSLSRMAIMAGLHGQSRSRADQFVAVLRRGQREEIMPTADDHALLDLALRRFSETIVIVGEGVRAALDQHGRVAFHGATNGLNNFLWLAGLAGNAFITVYDGDETKRGRYLPTCPNPVRLAGSDPEYVREPVIWVSAMTFFQPILRSALIRGLPEERLRPLAVP